MASNLKSVLDINLNNSPNSSKVEIYPVRVVDVILDENSNPEIFSNYGEWSSIGGILFQDIKLPRSSPSLSNFAKPLFPNIKNYPLKNELVFILVLPNNSIQGNLNNISYYYFQPINIWNNIHHNAIPDPIFGENANQQQDYQQIENGSVRRVTDGSTEIDLGDTFKEKLDIKPLKPYEGDVIYEGRWGQSLRFGSTIQGNNSGDPITIIRNGQYDDGKDAWIPQVEDINQDKSSIYATTTQQIPIEVASSDYKSYNNAPTEPNKFDKEQIILSSGRLLMNSKSDSILLSSNKTINLNSLESVNIDSPKTVVQSKEVFLGDKNAKESVILGDRFLNDFKKLLQDLVSLGNALKTPIGTPIPNVPNTSLLLPATRISLRAQTLLNKVESYKSKTTKTK